MFKVYKKEIEVAGKKISLETGKVARQADGAIIASSGETVIQFNDSTPSTLYYYCDIHAGMGAEITVE